MRLACCAVDRLSDSAVGHNNRITYIRQSVGRPIDHLLWPVDRLSCAYQSAAGQPRPYQLPIGAYLSIYPPINGLLITYAPGLLCY